MEVVEKSGQDGEEREDLLGHPEIIVHGGSSPVCVCGMLQQYRQPLLLAG